MAKILIADDDPTILSLLNKILLSKGYDVQLAEHGGVAEKLLKSEQFDLLISDIKMEPVDGMQLLRKTRQMRPHVGVIMLTAYATVATAVEAMKEGAFDYIPKPFKIDELLATVKRALDYQKSISEQISGDSQVELKKYFGNIVAESDEMINVCEMVKRVAPTKTTIMITGESGTGKEIVAEAVHAFSARSEGPFLPVNCAALPETLIESELFGHTKGAFTGASANKEGLFEAAKGGTLFLDEINSIPHQLQSKLLRAIQNKKIRKVGGTEEFEREGSGDRTFGDANIYRVEGGCAPDSGHTEKVLASAEEVDAKSADRLAVDLGHTNFNLYLLETGQACHIDIIQIRRIQERMQRLDLFSVFHQARHDVDSLHLADV